MTTQVFRGRTLDEARKAASDALGKDAVVLTTRHRRRSGMAGLLGGMDCEIAAAVVNTPPAAPVTSNAPKGPFASSAYAPAERGPTRDPIAALRSELRAELRAAKVNQERPTPAAPPDLARDIAAIREQLDQLTPTPPRGDKATALVRVTGIEGRAAAALSRAMRARKEGAVGLEERLRDAVSELIHVTPWPLSAEGRAVIAVVGPTGVGKTTTLAKLAARAKFEGKTVTLVTCDTFRVGGVEHLERYADLLGMPVAVARDASELASILASATTDLVLVDTSGREPVVDSAERLLSVASFAAAPECRPFSRHVLLCMPANVRAVDVARVVKAFATANPTAIAMTKLDETDAPSGLAHAPYVSKLPIAVLCAGQRVPEDVAPATMAAILDAVMRPVGRGASK
jgi:flagellar biosynthesis protein FlhF